MFYCSKITSLHELLFKFMSKVRCPCFWSPQSKFLATPLL